MSLVGATKAARHLGVDVKLVRRWTRNDLIPHFRDPETGRPVYSTVTLDEWQTRQGQNAADECSPFGIERPVAS